MIVSLQQQTCEMVRQVPWPRLRIPGTVEGPQWSESQKRASGCRFPSLESGSVEEVYPEAYLVWEETLAHGQM